MSQSTTFVAVYRGKTVSTARIVGISADPALVEVVCGQLLSNPTGRPSAAVEPQRRRGRQEALRAAVREVPT